MAFKALVTLMICFSAAIPAFAGSAASVREITESFMADQTTTDEYLYALGIYEPLRSGYKSFIQRLNESLDIVAHSNQWSLEHKEGKLTQLAEHYSVIIKRNKSTTFLHAGTVLGFLAGGLASLALPVVLPIEDTILMALTFAFGGSIAGGYLDRSRVLSAAISSHLKEAVASAFSCLNLLAKN